MQRLNVASLQILQNGLSFGHQRKANRLYLKNASEKMTQLLLPPETLLASSRQQHVTLCQNGWIPLESDARQQDTGENNEQHIRKSQTENDEKRRTCSLRTWRYREVHTWSIRKESKNQYPRKYDCFVTWFSRR
jgi:hypothetical protein